jgi:hypothetical protein
MAKPRAFISFEMEDYWARNLLAEQAKDGRNEVEFYDYSVKNPFDSQWKTECKRRISLTKGTIVLVGSTTHRSEAVLWEIAETTRQGHAMFGIQINRDQTHRIPAGLSSQNVIRWNFDQIIRWLSTWG